MSASLLLLALLPGCKPPPEAPGTLDDLCSYLFAHHADEDPAAMEAGLDELAAWLEDRWEETEEGYEIGPVDDATADTLDGTDRAVEGLRGLAVATRSVHTVDEAAAAMFWPDLRDVYPDMFEAYERTIPEAYDLDCFLDHTCDRIEAGEVMDSDFYGLVSTHSESWNEYLWVEAAAGPALVQRNWLVEPPEVSVEAVQVDAQYYINLFMPRDGGFWRLQATWMIYAQSAVDEDWLLQLAVGNMNDNSVALDAFLDEEYGEQGAATAGEEEGGCAAVPGRRGAAGLLLALVALMARRRR